jgi:hypothetical protein
MWRKVKNKIKQMETIEQALEWYKQHNINAYIDGDFIYIKIGIYEIEVSQEEIRFRAGLQQNNIKL